MPDQPDQPAQNNDDAKPSFFGTVVRCVAIYVAINAFIGKRPSPTEPSFPGGADALASNGVGGVVNPKESALQTAPSNKMAALPAVALANAFGPNQLLDFRVFITETESFTAFDSSEGLVWEELGLVYRFGESRARNITLTPSQALLRNESRLWAHIYVSKAGLPSDPSKSSLGTAVAHAPLVKIVQRKIKKATRNLLSGEPVEPEHPASPSQQQLTTTVAADGPSAGTVEWIPHWKPALTLNFVEDYTVYPSPQQIPPQIQNSLVLDPAAGKYMPVVYVNEFWLMADRYSAINETVTELPLEMSFSVTSLMRWMLTEQMQQSLEQQAALHGDGTMDEMRRMFAETSPWLLAVTACVSLLHTVFDILAFKNDISFWKNNKSMKGLSFRSMIINLFFQTVIFLYLMDNDTSWMILASSGVGLAIEGWKCTKAVKSVSLETKPGSTFPTLVIVPTDSYTMSPTKLYDDEAMRYLNHAIYPLVVGYSLYSLAYDSHKSYYSWLLGSTVNFVYSFGFVLMTPQLFINYKLKSTAHMPWKTFMYKALNTFIDDLFAFIIKMPTMHRLSCLRDDFIFFIYLYQRWSYGVDKKRANEFGQVGEDLDDATGLPLPKPDEGPAPAPAVRSTAGAEHQHDHED